MKILEELESDARKPYKDIAVSVGKTEATIRRRVQKLIDKNIIKKFTIEHKKSDKFNIGVTIKIAPELKDIKRILKELKEIREITNIWRLSGDCGILIKAEVPSIESFNPFLEGLISQIKGIKVLETCFITDIIK